MSEIILIAAIAKNNIIGDNGRIPWNISADSKYFKELTLNYPCIMGRNTFESLPDNARPLPKRENVVLSSNKDYHPNGTTVFHAFNEAIDYCKKKYDKAFLIGGESIYKLGMNVADELRITNIHKEYKGDTLFPKIKNDEWKLVQSKDDYDKGENVGFSFTKYIKK